jgi:hypothetical protein
MLADTHATWETKLRIEPSFGDLPVDVLAVALSEVIKSYMKYLRECHFCCRPEAERKGRNGRCSN